MIVLDCSAAIEIVKRTERGLALQDVLLGEEEVISVDLLFAEAASVVRKHVLRGEIPADAATAYLREATGLVDRYYPMRELQAEVLTESLRLGHSTYDVFYFVLARRLGATLYTTDKKLSDLCLAHGVNAIAEVSF